MGIIFVISPVYLEALYEEAKPFDFRLQGYGNFTDACEGLLYTNVKDIIGYAYVADNLPKDLSIEQWEEVKANLIDFFLIAI